MANFDSIIIQLWDLSDSWTMTDGDKWETELVPKPKVSTTIGGVIKVAQLNQRLKVKVEVVDDNDWTLYNDLLDNFYNTTEFQFLVTFPRIPQGKTGTQFAMMFTSELKPRRLSANYNRFEFTMEEIINVAL